MVDAMKTKRRKHNEDALNNEPRKRRSLLRIRDIFRTHSTLPRNCSFSSRQGGFGDDNGSYTFRLVHQESGYAARSHGEEKILIFRSDRPGAIAKIVFSSLPPTCYGCAYNTIDAKINCLHVKEQYRGYDLGGLLFLEALASLRSRYLTNYDISEEDSPKVHESTFSSRNTSTIIQCHIDAEEDDTRYNKLVRFYEKLGCTVKSIAKVHYLSGSDGRTYRKVPMQITLSNQDSMRSHFSESDKLVSFLPLVLRFNESQCVSVESTRGPIRWLLVEDGKGNFQFRTTSGLYLTAKEDACYLHNPSLEQSDYVMESFSKLVFESYVLENFAAESRRWLIRFISTGLYLSVDTTTANLTCSREPTCWQASEQDFSLTWLGNYHEPGLVDSDSESRGSISLVDRL